MVTLGDFHITSDQGLLKDTQGYFRDTVIPRYNAPRYNADLAITRLFTPKVFLPHLLGKGKFSAKSVNSSL